MLLSWAPQCLRKVLLLQKISATSADTTRVDKNLTVLSNVFIADKCCWSVVKMHCKWKMLLEYLLFSYAHTVNPQKGPAGLFLGSKFGSYKNLGIFVYRFLSLLRVFKSFCCNLYSRSLRLLRTFDNFSSCRYDSLFLYVCLDAFIEGKRESNIQRI